MQNNLINSSESISKLLAFLKKQEKIIEEVNLSYNNIDATLQEQIRMALSVELLAKIIL